MLNIMKTAMGVSDLRGHTFIPQGPAQTEHIGVCQSDFPLWFFLVIGSPKHCGHQ